MFKLLRYGIHPTASEESMEVANLTERKNPHTPVYGVKEFVCLSVRPSDTNFNPNYLGTVFVSPFLLQKQLIYDNLAGIITLTRSIRKGV